MPRAENPRLPSAGSGAGTLLSLAGLGAAAAVTIALLFGVGLLLMEQPGGIIQMTASRGLFLATSPKLPVQAVAMTLETQKSHVIDGIETLSRQNPAVPRSALPKSDTAAGKSMLSPLAKPPTALAPPTPLRVSPPAPAKSGPAVDKPPAAQALPASLDPPTDREANDAPALAATLSEAQAAPSASHEGTTSVDRGASSIPSAADIKTFLARGDAALRAGDPISARLFYQRAYEAGESRGALGMAASYDPLILQRFHISAQQSNPTEAFEWYIRARELAGSETAGPPKNGLKPLETHDLPF